MIVYNRFSDRVSFIALTLCVFLSFIICVGIYTYEFYQTADFWEEGAKCIASQDFKCILEIRSNQSINKELMLSTLGACLSIQGVIFGFLIVFLFRGFSLSTPKKDQLCQ